MIERTDNVKSTVTDYDLLLGINIDDLMLFSAAVASEDEIKRLDEVRAVILKQPERLDMFSWHSSNWRPAHTPQEEHQCGSTHCIAGWLQALCEDKDIRAMSAEHAGRLLAPTSEHMFYSSNERVLSWLKDREYAGSS